jgi:hypothetical protein
MLEEKIKTIPVLKFTDKYKQNWEQHIRHKEGEVLEDFMKDGETVTG